MVAFVELDALAPDFLLPDFKEKPVRLSDYRQTGVWWLSLTGDFSDRFAAGTWRSCAMHTMAIWRATAR